VGKGQAVASPSPLSPWGRFPLLTGMCVSHPGRPPRQGPLRGVRIHTFPCTHLDFPTRHKTPVRDRATLQTPGGRLPYPRRLHTPHTPPEPTIQRLELAEAGGTLGGDGADGSPDHPVDLQDHRGVAVVTASGSRLPLPLEAFCRLAPHADGAGRDLGAEQRTPWTESGQPGFVRVASPPAVVLDTRGHRLQRPFRLALGWAQDHKLVRVAHERVAQLLPAPGEMVQDDGGQQG
jgi:hypothetical protein